MANGEQGKQKKKRREEIVQVQQPPQRTTQRGPPTAAATAEADDRLPRTVFVGNLPAHVKRKSLAQLFAGCGRVESVRLRSLPLQRDPTSKIPRRGAIASGAIDADQSAHAYVVFADDAAADAALTLNMQEFQGHLLRVDHAAPKGGKEVVFDPQRSLFVGNLAHDIKDQEIIHHFGAANLEAVRVVRDSRTGVGKGVAFILFKSQEASKTALKQQGAAELKGRTLRLTGVKRQQEGKAAWQQGTGGHAGKSGSSKAAGGKPVVGRRKVGGKRPAVAARKLAPKQQEEA